MQGIYNYRGIPETNHVPRVHSVAAVLYLQFELHVMLFRPWIIISIIIINPVITLMQAIYNYVRETNSVSTVYSIAAVLYLQFVLHVTLFRPWIIIIIIIIPVITLMQAIYNYIPETNPAFTVYSIAAVLYLLFVLHVMLFRLYFYISTSRSLCAVSNMAVFCSSLTIWRRNYFFLLLAHPVYKMWIMQEPNTLELWNKLHFEEKKTESIYHV